MEKVVSHPFRFVTKSWVVKQYQSFRITELFDLTRSCEGEFDHINYKNYLPYQFVPVCGECFWCKEREWGIEQNK
jgi:7-cyano-7-deazaguanine synthase in queuosine biosynthesis